MYTILLCDHNFYGYKLCARIKRGLSCKCSFPFWNGVVSVLYFGKHDLPINNLANEHQIFMALIGAR